MLAFIVLRMFLRLLNFIDLKSIIYFKTTCFCDFERTYAVDAPTVLILKLHTQSS